MSNNAENRAAIILASKSPRRIRMLKQLDIPFTVVESLVDEESIAAETPEALARTLSIAKAESVSHRYPDHWVIGADSIVSIDGLVLNKPSSPFHAREMLTRLSGRTHRVMTGYAVFRQTIGHRFADVVISEVEFKMLRKSEIDWYLGTPEPYDKAGSYAIQGIGAFMVRRINGSYTNVVGLPLAEVLDHLVSCSALDHLGSKPPAREGERKGL